MVREDIEQRIADALKNSNKTELAVWRALKNEFLVYKTAKAGNEIDDAMEMKLIQKMVSQRKDSFEQYSAAGRMDLAENEKAEMEVLEKLLPKEPTEDELREYVTEIINLRSEVLSMKDMKYLMDLVRSKYPTANGGVIAKLVKEGINNQFSKEN